MRFQWIAIAIMAFIAFAQAAEEPGKSLLDLSAEQILPSSPQVTTTRAAEGLLVTCPSGQDAYPGIALQPQAPWDLSKFGHVEAKITNIGPKPLTVCLRIDNAGDWKLNPWNAENLHLTPGQSGAAVVRFGYAWGKRGYPLKPSAITAVRLFTTKSPAEQSFRIESVRAAGQPGEAPPVDPKSIRTKPKDGLLLDSNSTIEQLELHTARASINGQSLQITFPPAKADQSVLFKPPAGRWDLRDSVEIQITVRNDGKSPVSPKVRVESNGGPSDWITAPPIAPSAQHQLSIPFIAPAIWTSDKQGGNHVTNDAISAVNISVPPADEARALTLTNIRAVPPAPAKIPEWLGKRPPVEGEWTKTFDEDFDAPAIDSARWNIYGNNYWDKQSHFSKDNVILANGTAALRFQRKPGHHNDDPKAKQTDYATGYLDTYGKWAQRYGYFEARMKLPTAPGLWPAFWLMPDRGPAAGEQWKRQDTANGGMEFDVMEHLTRWGPLRYNIAMHWDGYGKDHKQTGTDKIYFATDKDGYVTAGLLWTPGRLVYYCNGQEVLRWENPRVSTVPALMMFTLPMGGWDNDDLDDAKLPADFKIDYVRAWQRKDLAPTQTKPD